LRERKEDIYILFRKFATDFAEKNRFTAVQLDDAAQNVLMHYSWPGNVRELKNIAEQISILAKDRMVNAEEILQFIPEQHMSRLPAIGNFQNNSDPLSYTERDLLYKFVLELKKDVSDLKKFIFELAQGNNIQMPDNYSKESAQIHNLQSQPLIQSSEKGSSQIAFNKNEPETHVVEEPKSLADMEKEMIIRSLGKHKKKRKIVALELGISERTLYRKMKEYNIKD
jgi:DNA-binding NtrC family response regulator